MKTYFITGGAGFLGKSIIRLLCEKNIDKVSRVIVYDLRIRNADKEELHQCCNDANIAIEFVIGDITSMGSINDAMKDVDVVIHAAAMIDFKGLVSKEVIWNINVNGTQNVIDACLRKNVQHLVYTSSLEAVCPNEYGDDFVDGDEDTEYRGEPIGKYGKSKKAAERLVTSAHGYKLANNKSFRTVSLRMAGVYGEEDPIISGFMERASKTKVVVGLQLKPTTRMYVGNSAWCHVLAAKKLQVESEKVGGNAYFIRDETPDRAYTDTNMEFVRHLGFTQKPSPIPFAVIYAITWIITLFYRILRLFGSRKEPMMTTYTLRVVSCIFTTTDKKFRRDFGYTPLYDWPATREKMKQFAKSFIEDKTK